MEMTFPGFAEPVYQLVVLELVPARKPNSLLVQCDSNQSYTFPVVVETAKLHGFSLSVISLELVVVVVRTETFPHRSLVH